MSFKWGMLMRRLLGAAVVCLLSASALALTEAEARAGGVERAEGDAVSFFADPRIRHLGHETVETNGLKLSVDRYVRYSTPLFGISAHKAGVADLSSFVPVRKDQAIVDLATMEMRRVSDFSSVKVGPAPIAVADAEQVPRRVVWREMSPKSIVDAIYRPGNQFKMKMEPQYGWWYVKLPLEEEPWTKMKTEDFLPCFDKYGQFKWRTWPGKTVSDADLRAAVAEEERDLAAHPGREDRDRFGGWLGGPQLKATGRFRTEKVDGRWWLVDPDGRLFWSWGPVRVTPSFAVTPLNGNPRTHEVGGDLPDRDCLFEGLPPANGQDARSARDPLAAFYETCDELLRPFYLKRNETRRFDFSSANLYRKYGEKWFERFTDSCHRRLRSWGCNTIANSSDLRICLQDRTPYAERVECQSRPIAGSWGGWWKFRDPWDVSFKEGVRASLERHGREAHDPWCIGFFIDNEINWGKKPTDLAEWTLASPDDQPAKAVFLKRLAERGIDPKNVPTAELEAFTKAVVDEYFRRTREAVKEFDAGLQYLGCRFAGFAPCWAIGAAAKYCDVVSYNVYRHRMDTWRLPQKLDAPVLIGEFHFGAHDRGLFGSGLVNAGSQEGRAKALRTYVDSALANPQLVGVHWHQFGDQPTSGRFDGEHFQVGWVDICDRPYRETVDTLRAIDIYAQRRNR